MPYAWKPLSDGCRIYIYWGCSRETDEELTQDAVETDTWWFDNTPVSTKNLRLIGTSGADEEFIVNFDLEPLTGRLTIDAAVDPVGGYDSISASYNYYDDLEIDIMTTNYKVTMPSLSSELDIFGQPHYQVHNQYPNNVTFNIVLERESSRNLLTEAMFRACYFLLLDKGTGATYGVRAFEGPIESDEQGSLYKGASHTLPIKLDVQQFGLVDEEATGAITAAENPGGGYTSFVSGAHGLATGDWVVITGTTSYNGTWKVTYLDDNNFKIQTAFVANETGTWTKPEEIQWGFFSN